jgi:hypothetical protein
MLSFLMRVPGCEAKEKDWFERLCDALCKAGMVAGLFVFTRAASSHRAGCSSEAELAHAKESDFRFPEGAIDLAQRAHLRRAIAYSTRRFDGQASNAVATVAAAPAPAAKPEEARTP